MAVRANRSMVLIPVAALAAGMLAASVVGATAKTNVSSPSKLSVGPFGTTEIDPDPISKDNCGLQFGAAPGIQVGDLVVVQPPNNLEGPLFGIASEQFYPDTLTVQMCNVDDTQNSIDGDPRTWAYVVMR